ncbi:hypothetical protein [Jannaschia rubra]|uniref:DUF302 domain-containing protein n=1 Tax=Jannaschia rubra TaxID=282197 RepID=A0A0M6XJT1_9RHOB|nr:hypothetical protein [Jannaschia rubra]CTQ31359.1 hypothetical protein JAN5088_00114 [Jannaschia rubra]SFF81044.1 hypothetical protein SAMN04488517_101303 [Jannaschia rubra]
MRTLTFAAVMAVAGTCAMADDIATEVFEGDVGDAAFAVENAIVDAGLVIDYVSNVGDMLDRTGADLDLGPSPVGAEAKIFVFCSALVSREVMEADPMNVSNCPYGIFVADIDGATVVGHRRYAAETMEPVNVLLSDIVAAAIE